MDVGIISHHWSSVLFLFLFFCFPRPDAVQPSAPDPHYRVVHFDVSGVDLTNSTMVKAEFRIFRAPNPQARASEQRVEIYQVNKGALLIYLTCSKSHC